MTETDRARALTALPEEIREALADYENVATAVGVQCERDDMAEYEMAYDRCVDAHARLVAAITAALARGAADTARVDWLEQTAGTQHNIGAHSRRMLLCFDAREGLRALIDEHMDPARAALDQARGTEVERG